jgi:hypothetical protein
MHVFGVCVVPEGGPMKLPRVIVLLALAQGLAGCGSELLGPSPVAAIQLVAFTDPASGFSTTDVRDVEEQIVRFNTANELIWTADDTRFRGYPVRNAITRYFIGWNQYYEVSFATRDGERRAYLCADDDHDYVPPTICKIEVVGGQLVITETGTPCPGVGE